MNGSAVLKCDVNINVVLTKTHSLTDLKISETIERIVMKLGTKFPLGSYTLIIDTLLINSVRFVILTP